MKNLFSKVAESKYFRRFCIPAAAVLVAAVLLATVLRQASPPDTGNYADTPPTPIMAAPPAKQAQTPKPTPEPTSEPTPAPTPTPTPDPYNGEYNPLSGEPWDEDLSKNRPWAVAIGNTGDAIPQHGIGTAEIICEYVIERATRIMAIYQDISQVEEIGGIRSFRTSSMEIAASYDAIFAHWIGRAYDNTVANGSPVTVFGTIDACGLGYRHPDRANVQDAMATGPRLVRSLPESFRTQHEGAFRRIFNFTENAAPEDGLPAHEVVVSFFDKSKKTTFIYDSDDGTYTAYQFGYSVSDGLTNERMRFTNVLIVQAEMIFGFNGPNHTYIKTFGEGSGYYVNGGKFVRIKWSRDNETAPYRYFLTDGTPLEIGIGKTYICVIHDDQTPVFYTYEE